MMGALVVKGLTKAIDLKLETVHLIIYTCFILHNFCQTKSTFLLDEDKLKAHVEQSVHIITSLGLSNAEAVTHSCSLKKVFLKMSKN